MDAGNGLAESADAFAWQAQQDGELARQFVEARSAIAADALVAARFAATLGGVRRYDQRFFNRLGALAGSAGRLKNEQRAEAALGSLVWAPEGWTVVHSWAETILLSSLDWNRHSGVADQRISRFLLLPRLYATVNRFGPGIGREHLIVDKLKNHDLQGLFAEVFYEQGEMVRPELSLLRSEWLEDFCF